MSALHSGILPNIRFFGAFKKCDEGDRSIDCPQDATSDLIQRLFPSPDGSNFVANQGSKDDILSGLKPDQIGRLLQLILNAKPTVKGDFSQKIDSWTLAVKFTLDGNEDTKSILNDVIQSELSKPLDSSENLILLQIQKTFLSPQNSLSKVLKKQKSKRNTIENLKQQKWEKYTQFAHTLLFALKETNEHDSSYPQDIVPQAFMTYLLKKGESKQAFIDLIEAMPYCQSATWQSLDRDGFLKSAFSKEDYATDINLVQDPEEQAFYLYKSSFSSLPPIVGYQSAAHKSLGKKRGPRKYETYPDCGETSLRNFFNIVLYDRKNQSFDKGILEKTSEKHELNLGLQYQTNRSKKAF